MLKEVHTEHTQGPRRGSVMALECIIQTESLSKFNNAGSILKRELIHFF
jgi:hypothetical protein